MKYGLIHASGPLEAFGVAVVLSLCVFFKENIFKERLLRVILEVMILNGMEYFFMLFHYNVQKISLYFVYFAKKSCVHYLFLYLRLLCMKKQFLQDNYLVSLSFLRIRELIFNFIQCLLI